MKKFPLLFQVIFLAATMLLPAYAQGDISGTPWERFSVSLGGTTVLSNSDVRVGTDVIGSGIDIDVEEALNVDASQSAVKLDVSYRIGEKGRHRVSLSYFELRRKGTVVLEKEIEIGDPPITIPAGDVVDTFYDTGILNVDYAYSFFIDDRFNLAASGGIFVLPIELGVANRTSGESTKTDITAPLPVVGISFDFAVSPKWMLRQSLKIFYLKLGDFTGGIVDTTFAVEWNVWKNWGFGAALNAFRLAIKSESDDEDVPGVDFIGDLKLDYTGVMLYTRYRF